MEQLPPRDQTRLPDREVVDVPLEHEIFHIVYDLKEKPQIPSIGLRLRRGSRSRVMTWEQNYDGWERQRQADANYRAIYDDQGRIMVFICTTPISGEAGSVRRRTSCTSASSREEGLPHGHQHRDLRADALNRRSKNRNENREQYDRDISAVRDGAPGGRAGDGEPRPHPRRVSARASSASVTSSSRF